MMNMLSTRDLPPLLLSAAALLLLAAGQPAGAQAPANSCAEAVQGKIAWNYQGNKHWARKNIDRLCRDAEDSGAPARCFDRVMHGGADNAGIDWGGGTRWQWQNALDLCQGARNADARIACFEDRIAAGAGWKAAIDECARQTDTAGRGDTDARADIARSVFSTKAKNRTSVLRQQGRVRTDADRKGADPDAESGTIRFGDGESGRVPKSKAGPDRPVQSQTRPPAESLAPAVIDDRPLVRLKPRISHYEPPAVMQGGTLAVRGHLLGKAPEGRRLILGVSEAPDHALSRALPAGEWSPDRIETRIPDSVLPGTYFIAVRDEGRWVTNRLRELRVLAAQTVTVEAEALFRCYADVTQYPREIAVTFDPLDPEAVGMDDDETLSVRARFDRIERGNFGRRLYVYEARLRLPHGVYEIDAARPAEAPYFKAVDWSRAEGAEAYYNSEECGKRLRVHYRTKAPLTDPPTYVFKATAPAREQRIGQRTGEIRVHMNALADPAELGALPPPTPVDE